MLDIDSLWDYKNPAESEYRFRELYSNDAFANPNEALEVITQIARAQGMQGNFNEAHLTLDAVVKQVANASKRIRIRYMIERGRILNASGRPQEALQLLMDAYTQGAEGGEESLAIDAAHMAGIISGGDQQMQWDLCALSIAENSADRHVRRWCAILYNSLGWYYFERGSYSNALDYFQREVPLRESVGGEPLRVARWAMGRTLRAMRRFHEALEIQYGLSVDLMKSRSSDGYVDEELAECLLGVGREDEARLSFKRAYAILSQDPWLSRDEPQRLLRLACLGSTPRARRIEAQELEDSV